MYVDMEAPEMTTEVVIRGFASDYTRATRDRHVSSRCERLNAQLQHGIASTVKKYPYQITANLNKKSENQSRKALDQVGRKAS
jgi:hypothetical protein